MNLRDAIDSVLKWGMWVFCAPFVLLGIALIAVGTLALTRSGEFDNFLVDGFYSIPALLIVTGVFVTVLFIFGCVGLKKESYWPLMIFSVVLGIILVMEVAGGISAFVLRDKTEGIFNGTVADSFNNSYNPKSPIIDTQKMWEGLQSEMHCCGVNSYLDYSNLPNHTSIPVSTACCKNETNIPCNLNNTDTIYTKGCLRPIIDTVESSISMVAKWSLLVAFLQLLWIAGACHLAIKYRRQNQYETV